MKKIYSSKNRHCGSGLPIIDCVKDRLENLNKPFSGEASKTTEVSQNGKGGGTGSIMMLCDLSLDTRAKTVKRGGSVFTFTMPAE